MSGIWHRLTGRYAKVKAQNETEALEGLRRDRGEKDDLVFRQIEERQKLQQDIKTQREAGQEELLQLRADVAEYMTLDNNDQHHYHTRKPDHDPDGDDDGPRPRPPRSRRRRGFEP
jgi:hypothetical protein